MTAVATSPQFLADQVAAATAAMREHLAEHEGETWSPRGLMSETPGSYPTTVLSMAFWALVKAGEIVVDDDFAARAA